MLIYIIPVGLLSILGAVVGLVLLYASQKFAVKENPLVEEIADILPGSNCGACGFAGCHGLAVGYAADPDLEAACPVGGEEIAGQIAGILGVEKKAAEKKVARILCGARPDTAARVPSYKGIRNCAAVEVMAHSTNICRYGCVMMGNCIRACPVDAIEIRDDALRVIEEKCIGCGICVKTCPRGCMEMIGANKRIWVACHSRDRGALVRKICKVGCIGCMKCEKNCPTGAIKVENFYAHIRQELCSMCGECESQCPTNAINVRPALAGEIKEESEEKTEAEV